MGQSMFKIDDGANAFQDASLAYQRVCRKPQRPLSRYSSVCCRSHALKLVLDLWTETLSHKLTDPGILSPRDVKPRVGDSFADGILRLC